MKQISLHDRSSYLAERLAKRKKVSNSEAVAEAIQQICAHTRA